MTLSKSKNSSLNNSNSTSNSNSNASNPNLINSNFYLECADCGSTNAQWASINHGIVLCDSCCLAHRSLGRCISVIKSLKKSYWPQSLIDTLYELVRSNSNNIWESTLLNMNDSSSSTLKQLNLTLKNLKKPSQKDSNSAKLNYIKMKYENLTFISRGKYSSIEDLNQQLMSAVKTNSYELSLRILSQGADSNYRSQEDGNQCLHAAVLNNQLGQIELLCLYGADLTGLDRNGQTPYELAKSLNNQQIADRLLELQFELTDEISYFLCNKRPDHKSGKHFLIPDLNNDGISNNTQKENLNKKLKLDELPDHLFEELSKDIYDELDRRQIETIWKCTVGPTLVNEPIPFLVIKSCFTQTRNQLRQKLARFNTYEFSSLLIEILNESQRRYMQIENANNALKSNSEPRGSKTEEDLEEDEDLYDKVPSDEDYASVASESSSTVQLITEKSGSNGHKTNASSQEEKNKQLQQQQQQQQMRSPLKLAISPQHMANKNAICSPTQSISSSSSSNRSNKNTPSPGSKFSSLKILNTKFDKVPANLNMNSNKLNSTQSNQTLVANAESALNSIINSLNQIDLTPNYTNSNSNNNSFQNNSIGTLSSYNNMTPKNTNFTELKSENQLMQAMIERLMEENAQLRAENMLLITNTPQNVKNTTNYISQNINNYYTNEELCLYSSIKTNKATSKTNSIERNQNRSILNSSQTSSQPNHSSADNLNLSLNDYQKYELFNNKLFSNQNKRMQTEANNYANSLNNSQQNSSLYDEYSLGNINNKGLKFDNNLFESLQIIESNNYDDGLSSSVKASKPNEFVSSTSTTSSPSKLKLTQNNNNNNNNNYKVNSTKQESLLNTPHAYHQSHKQLQNIKLSPSRSIPTGLSTSPNSNKSSNNNQQNNSHLNNNNNNNVEQGSLVLPSKDSVIKKMKKITKAVQELFKATKQTDFSALKNLCDKVDQTVHEMIILFPQNLNSPEIQENLALLEETSNQLINLTNKYHSKIELFAAYELANESISLNSSNNTNNNSKQLSGSSSTSSALSSNSNSDTNTLTKIQLSPDDTMLKSSIVSDLVSYSYEIAHTVKRIVCIMGADN